MMIEIVWFVPVIYVAVTIGVAITLGSWIAYDKRRENRIKSMVYDCNSWCDANCRHHEYCFSQHEDPDDAWKELESYCMECPMAKAVDVWEQQMQKEGKR